MEKKICELKLNEIDSVVGGAVMAAAAVAVQSPVVIFRR